MYRRIADDLRAKIASGELKPGQQLPTQLELAEEHDVARVTARQAVTELVNEGLVVIRRPQGAFVRDRRPLVYRPQAEFRPRPQAPEVDQYIADQSAEGRNPSQTIDVALVQAPPAVARRLGVSADQIVVVRRRVRSLDGEPNHLNDSYYPRELVEGSEIMLPIDIARGANCVLSELGAHQVRAVDEITVRMPTPDETHRLALGPGTPVAVHICTGYTERDEPVRCVINILPGDRHVIVFERAEPKPEPDNERQLAEAAQADKTPA